ncbi:polymorphic toxin-type HINT domain-containing protein, partial [Couchioplanes caeruleus]
RGAADSAEADAAKARQAADSAQKHADSAATAATKALEHAVEAQKAADRAEEAARKRANDAVADAAASGSTPPGPLDPDLLKFLTPEQQEELRRAQEESGKSILDFFKENAYQLFLDLSGVGDIMSCVRDGNVEACLWSLANLLPGKKILGALWDIGKLVPKLLKFLDNVKDASKKRDELAGLAQRNKRDADACPIPRRPSSFLPGTPVLLADGTTRAIEKLRVGDRVMATDPTKNTTAARVVTDTITSVGDKSLVEITVDTDGARGSKTSAVTATDNHPFWVPALADWVPAAKLAAGQWLRTSAGTTVQIAGVRQWTTFTPVHNLTIADLHTYYVLAGAASLLVHNQGDLEPGQTYLWRAVQGKELKDIHSGRQFSNPFGTESKYFSFTERGAAEYGRRAYGMLPEEGPYTVIRTVINKADIPGDAVMPHTADVVDGGVALPTETLKKLGRPRIMPSSSTGIGC